MEVALLEAAVDELSVKMVVDKTTVAIHSNVRH